MAHPLPAPVVRISPEATQEFSRLLRAVRVFALQKVPFETFEQFTDHIETVHKLTDLFHDAVLEATSTGAPALDDLLDIMDSPILGPQTTVRSASSSSSSEDEGDSSETTSASSDESSDGEDTVRSVDRKKKNKKK